MKVFTSPTIEEPNIEFEIDGDKFTAIPANRLPGGALDQYFKLVKEGEIFEAHEKFFKVVLDEDSFDLFLERFNSKERPLTLQMLAEVSTWLLGDEYMGGGSGNGQSAPVPPSTPGPKAKASGRRSTAGAPAKA